MFVFTFAIFVNLLEMFVIRKKIFSRKKGKPLSAAIAGSKKISSCFFISVFSMMHWADRGRKTTFTSIVKQFPNFPIGREIKRINSAHLNKVLLFLPLKNLKKAGAFEPVSSMRRRLMSSLLLD